MKKTLEALKKHKTKLIAAVVIIAALSAAWFYGGNYPAQSTAPVPSIMLGTAENTMSAEPLNSAEPTSLHTPVPPAADITPDAPNTPEKTSPPPTGAPDVIGNPAPSPDVSPGSAAPTGINPDKNPGSSPLPTEPEDAVTDNDSFTVTLIVRCDALLSNMNLLDGEKHELVPADGVIFDAAAVTVYEGESVFNVLQRSMKQAKIHMAFRNTPFYNSAYIEGINNLYEFDAGELSGWMYRVNGLYPGYGCSRYLLEPGDVIEWHYTCDLGRDIGQDFAGGQSND